MSRLLGHAKPSITLDVYAQLLPSGFDTLLTLGGQDALPALPDLTSSEA